MSLDGFALGVLVGVVLGGGVAAFVARGLGRQLAARLSAEAALRERDAQVARERSLDETADGLREAFRTLTGEALGGLTTRLGELERERARVEGQVGQQLGQLAEAHGALAAETQRLTRVLAAPGARGRWGEVQLRRVVELAGLSPHVDFELQVTTDSDEGKKRPDLVVNLPGGRRVVVDAKAPLDALAAAATAVTDEARATHLAAHASAVRGHVRALASRGYARAVGGSAEFVVLFLPGESALPAALEADPELLEHAAGQGVVLATPSTLLALLRAVALTWQHERAAAHARDIVRLGRELADRAAGLGEHFTALKKALDAAQAAAERAERALETRVLASARKLGELEAPGAGAPGPDAAH